MGETGLLKLGRRGSGTKKLRSPGVDDVPCVFAGADSSMLTSCSHVQTIRLRVSGRRTREDGPTQSDASRGAVDGRLEEVLPGGDVQLADQAHLSVGQREAFAGEEEDLKAQFKMQKLPVVGDDIEVLCFSNCNVNYLIDKSKFHHLSASTAAVPIPRLFLLAALPCTPRPHDVTDTA